MRTLDTRLPATPAAALVVAQSNLRYWIRRLEEARADALVGQCSELKLKATNEVVAAATERVRELTAIVKADDQAVA